MSDIMNVHSRQWLYMGLLFAQGYPPGTHPLDNERLLGAIGDVAGLLAALDYLAKFNIVAGWSAGAA